nr:MAG TPA: hypothetical protein [Caudoviricetes sp.]
MNIPTDLKPKSRRTLPRRPCGATAPCCASGRRWSGRWRSTTPGPRPAR